MKKLLALVLCVMMFVAIIPTNAFAWEDKAVSSTAVKEAEKSIKNMYTAIATDELVFGTAQSLHDLFDGLSKQMFDGVDSIDVPVTQSKLKPVTTNKAKTYHDDLVDNTRAYLKGIVGDSIAKYISDRTSSFKSDTINGGVDPEKYLKVFTAAVNEAVSSEKAQKGIEKFVNNLAMVKVMDSAKTKVEDVRDAIKDWGTGKWREFGPVQENGFGFDPDLFVYNFDGTNEHYTYEVIDMGVFWHDEYDNPLTNPWAYMTTDGATEPTEIFNIIMNDAG